MYCVVALANLPHRPHHLLHLHLQLLHHHHHLVVVVVDDGLLSSFFFSWLLVLRIISSFFFVDELGVSCGCRGAGGTGRKTEAAEDDELVQAEAGEVEVEGKGEQKGKKHAPIRLTVQPTSNHSFSFSSCLFHCRSFISLLYFSFMHLGGWHA